MELILNLLTLQEKQREDFLRAANGYEQIFAPAGVLEHLTAFLKEEPH